MPCALLAQRDDDRNGPLSATERIVEQVPDASLGIWHGAGHTAPSRFMPEVLTALIHAPN